MSGPTNLIDQVYGRIREIELLFPIPAPVATIDVGTFDAAADRFTFSQAVKRVTQTIDSPPDEPRGKPIRVTEYFLAVNAVSVTLRFRVANSQGDVSAEVNGVSWPAASGRSVVTAFIGVASAVRFTIKSGPKTFTETDILNIVRPPIIGAGVFRIPTFPVLLIPDPPADKNRRNRAIYTASRSQGVSTSVSFSGQETIKANFLTPSQLAGLWTRSLLDIAAAYDLYKLQISDTGQQGGGTDQSSTAVPDLKNYTNPVTELIAALPSASFQSSNATTDTSDQTLNVTITDTTTIGTQGGLGPGLGDVIVYLANVRLIWSVINGDVFLSVLGWDTVVVASAESIKSEIRRLEQLPVGGGGSANGGGTAPNLTTLIASFKALLALDPPAVGESLRNNPRYAGPDDDPNLATVQLSGPATFTYQIQHSVTQSDKTEQVETEEQTEDQSPGFLSILLPFLGDPTRTTSITTKSTRSSSTQITVGETLTTLVNLNADINETYAVTFFFDKVFNTLAYEGAPISGTVIISGLVRSPTGEALAAEPVTVFNNMGHQYITLTDDKGQFSFNVKAMIPKVTLMAGTTTKEVEWSSDMATTGIILVTSQPTTIESPLKA